MTTILAAIFVFGLLVTVHELGHFAVAKWTGMRVDEFAIGFGPALWQKKYGETLYSLRMIPLGGFNRIAGMDYEVIENAGNGKVGEDGADGEVDSTIPGRPGYVDPGERAYFRRPIWARMLVILAGSAMNLILPIFIFWGLFLVVGVGTPSPEPVIGTVVSDRPADMAGLQSGDRILSIDGQPVEQWQDISERVQDKAGHPFSMTYQRGEQVHETTVMPVEDERTKRAVIGITSSVERTYPGVIEGFGLSVKHVGSIIVAMVGALAMLIQGVGASDLSGPVGVAQMAGQVAQQGIAPLFSFAAFLSLNLGIVNLLPVPALDGGHFVMLVLEALRGKPLGQKAMYYIQMTGVALLMGLMVFATFNDITR